MWRLERVLIDGYNIPKESSDSRDESFFSFATLLRNCDFGAALIHPFIKDVVSPILKSSGLKLDSADDLKFELEAAADQYMDQYDGNLDDDDVYRRLAVLSTGVLFLRIYSQVSVTGPNFDHKTASEQVLDRQRGVEKVEHYLSSLTIFGHPDVPQSRLESSLSQSILTGLIIDGEEPYHLSPCLSYLYCARVIFDMKPLERGLCSTILWRSRSCFLHQRSLTGGETSPSPYLLKASVRDLTVLLKSIGALPDAFHLGLGEDEVENFSTYSRQIGEVDRALIDVWALQGVTLPPITRLMSEAVEDALMAAELVLELAGRLAFFGRHRAFQKASEHACELAGFFFELTGAEGIRRKYQTRAFAQLVVRKFRNKQHKLDVLAARERGEEDEYSAAAYKDYNGEYGVRTVEAPGYVEDREKEEKRQALIQLGVANDRVVTEESLAQDKVNEETYEQMIDRVRTATGVANVTLKDADPDNELIEHGVLLTGSAKEREGVEDKLNVLEQALLLSHCQSMLNMVSASDEVTALQMSALVHRMLIRHDDNNSIDKPKRRLIQQVVNGKTIVTETSSSCEDDEDLDGNNGRVNQHSNWLTFSAGLWFRCSTENHRIKTQDRSALQLSILADQFNDRHPTSRHRLRFLFCLNYPLLWELRKEVAVRNMKLGASMTAFEQFKSLELWDNVGECLIVANRKNEALEILTEIADSSTSPNLLCILGDLRAEDIEYYKKAWDISKNQSARAQRSIARALFKRGDIEGASNAFELALAVNPLNFNAWFTKGNCDLKLNKLESAFNSYSRCVSIDDSDADSWGNLVAIATKQSDWRKAHYLSEQACRRGRENWRLWVSRLSICVQVRDLIGAAESVRTLALIGSLNRVDVRMLNWISYAACNDDNDVFILGGRPAHEVADIVLRALLAAVKKNGSGAPSLPPKPTASQTTVSGGLRTFDVALVDMWGVMGDIAAGKGVQDFKSAFEYKEKEWRLLQAHLEANLSSVSITSKTLEDGTTVTHMNRVPALAIALKLVSCAASQAFLASNFSARLSGNGSNSLLQDMKGLMKEMERLEVKVLLGMLGKNGEEGDMTEEEKQRIDILRGKLDISKKLINEAIEKLNSVNVIQEGNDENDEE